MPKMRTHSASKKRFKKTATGKIKHACGYRRHHSWAKSHKQVRHLRKGSFFQGGDRDHIESLLPY